MSEQPLSDPRYAVERLEEIDGTWRPVTHRGRPLVYRHLTLARAVARGYRGTLRVRDILGGEL